MYGRRRADGSGTCIFARAHRQTLWYEQYTTGLHRAGHTNTVVDGYVSICVSLSVSSVSSFSAGQGGVKLVGHRSPGQWNGPAGLCFWALSLSLPFPRGRGRTWGFGLFIPNSNSPSPTRTRPGRPPRFRCGAQDERRRSGLSLMSYRERRETDSLPRWHCPTGISSSRWSEPSLLVFFFFFVHSLEWSPNSSCIAKLIRSACTNTCIMQQLELHT
ncbi:hypothetical protein J3F83DRAFT_210876 [Trichoderma novae-zelandiae]